MSPFTGCSLHTFGFDSSCQIEEVGDWAEWSLRVERGTVALTTSSGQALLFSKAEWRNVCARVRQSWSELKNAPDDE